MRTTQKIKLVFVAIFVVLIMSIAAKSAQALTLAPAAPITQPTTQCQALTPAEPNETPEEVKARLHRQVEEYKKCEEQNGATETFPIEESAKIFEEESEKCANTGQYCPAPVATQPTPEPKTETNKVVSTPKTCKTKVAKNYKVFIASTIAYLRKHHDRKAIVWIKSHPKQVHKGFAEYVKHLEKLNNNKEVCGSC